MGEAGGGYYYPDSEDETGPIRALAAEWERLGRDEPGMNPFRTGYRAALRKCADELRYALVHGEDGAG